MMPSRIGTFTSCSYMIEYCCSAAAPTPDTSRTTATTTRRTPRIVFIEKCPPNRMERRENITIHPMGLAATRLALRFLLHYSVDDSFPPLRPACDSDLRAHGCYRSFRLGIRSASRFRSPAVSARESQRLLQQAG